ncbi:DUF7577 domain-containing protein [Halorubrum yunnanense]|uniref:Zinc ribbon domain-containing protein n=1 Tax=Halorubrum yunnanense TaxID=1526162 RepID=A0ABD5YAS3_9EURY|nr:zinc ribbon domain-containing protein [Halorubrum yunnanense]
MTDFGTVYLAVTGALLFVALALGFRVLLGVAREGLELRRRRRAGAAERHAKDEASGSEPPAGSDPPIATCPGCGADNEPGFSYCRRCAAPLRSDT